MADDGDIVLQRTVESLNVLTDFCDRDKTNREECYLRTKNLLTTWYHGFGSPKECSYLDSAKENGDYPNGDTSMYHLIDEQVPDLLRLSCTSPLTDVAQNCKNILNDLQTKGIKIPRPLYDGPSAFIPLTVMPHMESLANNDASCSAVSLFQDHYHQWCRLENYLPVLGFHTEYLDCFCRLHNHLMRGDCPLPYPTRHYIAIMAASRHKCEYLVRLHTYEFLSTRGDPEWLKGLDKAPSKLRDLSELNRLLAHRPWLVTEEHIIKLTKNNGRDNFYLAELMHAIALMTHIHSLCSLIFSCGIRPEVDHPAGHTYCRSPGACMSPGANTAHNNEPFLNGSTSGINSPAESETYECPVSELMDRMRRIHEEEMEEIEQDELMKRFQSVESQNAMIAASVMSEKQPLSPVVALFLPDPEFTYDKPNDLSLRTHDYSWDDDGVDLVNHLSSDLGSLLNEKFTIACELTYNTMASEEKVDTRAYRTAVWNCVHSLFGIRHDDYNYLAVEQLLQRPLKTFLMLATTSPETIKKKHYDRFMVDFMPSEKVHVNLMALEARLQATLIYAVRAIHLAQNRNS